MVKVRQDGCVVKSKVGTRHAVLIQEAASLGSSHFRFDVAGDRWYVVVWNEQFHEPETGYRRWPPGDEPLVVLEQTDIPCPCGEKCRRYLWKIVEEEDGNRG